MEQNATRGKSYIQVFKDMPTQKKTFLVCITISALFAFPVTLAGDSTLLYAIAIAIGIAGLVGVIGLIVVTLKEDSRRSKDGNGSDPLRIAFIVAAVLAIVGEVFFAGFSSLASFILVALTMIRAKKDSDNGLAGPVTESNKPTGLL